MSILWQPRDTLSLFFESSHSFGNLARSVSDILLSQTSKDVLRVEQEIQSKESAMNDAVRVLDQENTKAEDEIARLIEDDVP